MGMLLNGEAMDEYDDRGIRLRDDIFLLIVNSYWERVAFTLPGEKEATDWSTVVDTYHGIVDGAELVPAGETVLVPARSLLMYCRVPHDQSEAAKKSWKMRLASA